MSAQKELINVHRTVTTPLDRTPAAAIVVSSLMWMKEVVMVSLYTSGTLESH